MGLTITQSLVQLCLFPCFLLQWCRICAHVHVCTELPWLGSWCSSTRRGQNLNQEHDSGPWLQTEPRARLRNRGSRLLSQQASPCLSFLTYKTRINIPILAYFTASHWDHRENAQRELLSFRQDSYQKDDGSDGKQVKQAADYKIQLDHWPGQPSRSLTFLPGAKSRSRFKALVHVVPSAWNVLLP